MSRLVDTRLIMLDTETTDMADPKVVELAAMSWFYGTPIKPSDFKESFIHPGCLIDPASMSIHHILNEDVADAPHLDEVDAEWTEWVDDSVIVAYNSAFDHGVLKTTGMNDKPWFDAYRMAMHFWSLGQENDDGFPLTSFKQQELRYWLKLPKTYGDAHRAAADIQVTALVVSRGMDSYLACGKEDSWEAFRAYVMAPIQHATIPIGGRPYAGKTPEDLEDWALKRAFDPNNAMFEPFQKFNVHECLLPEYLKRFSHEPPALLEARAQAENAVADRAQRKSFSPRRVTSAPTDHADKASAPSATSSALPSTPATGSRWSRRPAGS